MTNDEARMTKLSVVPGPWAAARCCYSHSPLALTAHHYPLATVRIRGLTPRGSADSRVFQRRRSQRLRAGSDPGELAGLERFGGDQVDELLGEQVHFHHDRVDAAGQIPVEDQPGD